MRQLLIGLYLVAIATTAFAQTPAAAAASQAHASLAAGFRAWHGPMSESKKPLAGGIWYPAAGAGPAMPQFDSPIFQGVPVQPDAAIRPGRWPLVLLSHGVGGHWRSLAWLGAGLAQQGAIVVGVNHPGSTFGDYEMRRSLNHGSRVSDLKTTLDALLADAAMGPHIDSQRIYVAGFSLGGWTSLSIGGLRGDLHAYADYCARSGHRHCRDIARAGIDLTKLDARVWSRSYRDPRVKAVAAVDPALHQGLNAANASDMVDQVLLIGLGQGADRLPDTDFSAPGATLTGILPKARIEIMAPAFHFSALPVCKPAGAKLLAEDNDDPVCSDPPGTDRPVLHDRITRSIARHFGLVP
ncbi:MAG: prolyl oligopeptidase family serine peptidase [Rhodoferax sp.]|nr:prolyl oligopeptidase family serine peptidase [Rhodoferax sp.]